MPCIKYPISSRSFLGGCGLRIVDWCVWYERDKILKLRASPGRDVYTSIRNPYGCIAVVLLDDIHQCRWSVAGQMVVLVGGQSVAQEEEILSGGDCMMSWCVCSTKREGDHMQGSIELDLVKTFYSNCCLIDKNCL